jgi:hypothetical protein
MASAAGHRGEGFAAAWHGDRVFHDKAMADFHIVLWNDQGNFT